MLRRLTAILIVLSLLFGCAAAETAAEPAAACRIEMKPFPFHLVSTEYTWREDFPLYFVDGADDLPFVEMNDWGDLMNYLFSRTEDEGYQMTVEVNEAENRVVFTRETGYEMEVDFQNGTISFYDYMAFLQSANGEYMNPISIPITDRDGQPSLLMYQESRDLYGEYTVLDLKEYGIPMIVQDGKYLLPMQTLSAFLLSNEKYALYFNGQAVFFTSVDSMTNPKKSLYALVMQAGLVTPEILAAVKAAGGTQAQRMDHLFEEIRNASDTGATLIDQFNESMKTNLYMNYISVPKHVRSKALTEYGYGELCLELDCFYGLKDSHHISSFDTFFLQTGMYDNLMDPDASKADKAISDLVGYWLDDGHSDYLSSSWMTENDPDSVYGFNQISRTRLDSTLTGIRAGHPEAVQPYYEVGDTAYIYLDTFSYTSGTDYYQAAENGTLPNDTLGIVIQAHRQITRENSPIKNVVLDLSANGGGTVDTAIFTLGWFLGDAHFSYRNTFTGSQSTSIIRADVNLDHQFDENDTLSGRGLKLYCLISPASFSCGNLVPWAFKEDGGVTLLGRTTGGGSCMVGFITSPWGTSYRYSSFNSLSFVKNGSYYDVDQGVVPDYTINDYEHFYDREALTEFIHSLF